MTDEIILTIRLKNIRRRGRVKLSDGREVNAHIGDKKHGVGSVYFYIYRGARICIPEAIYHKLEKVSP
jgi:ribosomal protein S12